MKYLAFFIIGYASLSVANSQGYPNIGNVHNTQEPNYLSYKCQRTELNELECDFIQVRITKKLDPSKVEEEINRLMGYEETVSEESCQEQQLINDVLKGKKTQPAEWEDGLSDLTEYERQYTITLTDSIIKYCSTKSKKDLRAFFTIAALKETRTCSVNNQSFKQQFKFIAGPEGKNPTWVVKDSPNGTCGMINLSRFELDTNSSINIWNYISRRAITNPNAMYSEGVSCNEFEQNETLFDWRAKELTMECDFINFGAL